MPRITSPEHGASVHAGWDLGIMIEVLNATNEIRSVEVFENQRFLGLADRVFTFAPTDGPVFSFTYTNVTAGSHSLQAKATDVKGAFGWSPGVTIHGTNRNSEIPNFRVKASFLVNGHLVEKTYTPEGPLDGGPLIPGLRMVGEPNRYLFGAEPHRIVRYDRELRRVEELEHLPAALPELSWPMGAAYDPLRNRAVVVTLGGEGHLYQYYYASNTWTVLSSMNNRDFESLVYHRQTDSFYGAEMSSSSEGNTDITVTHLNQRGELFETMKIRDVPFHLGRGSRSELIQLENMLLLFLEGDPGITATSSPSAYRESRIYLVNPHALTHQLVWRKLWTNPINHPPTVRLIEPQEGAAFPAGTPIHFGIHAEDIDHNLRQVEVLANYEVIGLAAAAIQQGDRGFNYSFTWQNPRPGNYSIIIRATDALGASGITSSNFLRVLEPPMPPIRITYPVQNQIFTNPPVINISAIVEAPFTNPAMVEFFANGHLLSLAREVHTADLISGRLFTFPWTNPPVGAHRLVAKVTQHAPDRPSMVAESSAVEITVRSPHTTNLPPSVQLLSPQTGRTFAYGSAVELVARAVDADGRIATVDFFANGHRVGSGAQVAPTGTNAATYVYRWTNAAPGRYDLLARATDTHNASAISGSNWIVINPLVLTNVVRIAAPTNGAIFRDPSSILLRATVNARMSSPEKVEFFSHGQFIGRATEAPSVFPDSERAFELRWTNPPVGGQTLLARATSGVYATESQLVSIMILRNSNTPPRVTITSPENGATFTNPRSIQISALTQGESLARSVEFFSNGRSLGFGSLNPLAFAAGLVWDFTWTEPFRGTNHLEAVAVDQRGVTNRSPGVTIYVNPLVNPLLVVTRLLPPSYVHGQQLQVRLNAQPSQGVTAYAVEDAIPEGWRVVFMSHAGAYDSLSRKVKFGPFRDRLQRELIYTAIPPTNAVKTYEFAGHGSANGISIPIIGDSILRPAEHRHPADKQPADDRITLNELTAYAAEWNQNLGVPISYVTWAGSIWKAGEHYRLDPTRGGPPTWWVPTLLSNRVVAFSALYPSAERILPLNPLPGQTVTVSIAANPSGASSYAVEEIIPDGWSVTGINHGGVLLEDGNSIRWGPFLDREPRALSFTASPGANAGAAVFTGFASFDGEAEFIAGPAQPETLALRVSSQAQGRVALTFNRPAQGTVILESASSLDAKTWEPLPVTLSPDGASGSAINEAGAQQRFYRLRVE